MNGFNISDAIDIKLGSNSVDSIYYGSIKLWPTGPSGIPSGWDVITA